MKHLLLLVFLFFAGLAQAQQPVLETIIQKGHLKYVTCSSVSPDGKILATGSLDNSIKLWDIKNGKEIRSIGAHTEKVRTLQFSPDGGHLLTSSSDGTSKVIDILTAKVLHTFEMETDRMWAATYNETGTMILTMNDRYLYQVYDASTGEQIAEYEKSYGTPIYPESFGNGTMIQAKDYKNTNIVDIESGEVKAKIEFDKVHTYSFSPDGKYIAVGSTKLFAEIFDAATGKMLYHLEDDPETQCDGCNTLVRFSNNSKYLATGAKNDGVIIWDVANGKKSRKLMDAPNRIDHISFSNDDKYVMVRSGEEIIVFDRSSGSEKLRITDSEYEYYDPCFTPDGKYIVTPGDNNTTYLWSTSSGNRSKSFGGYLSHAMDNGMDFSYDDWTDASILRYLSAKGGVEVSPDDRYMVVGNVDSTVLMIDITTGKISQEFHGHSKSVWSFEFTDDMEYLFTAGGNSYINMWNVETGEVVKQFKGHRDLIFDISLSISNKYLVSSSWDGSIRIWDVESGEQTQYIDLNNNSAYSVKFASGDNYIYTGSLSDQFQMWEVDAGKLVQNMIGHTNIVSCIDQEFGYGYEIVSGSWDGRVKVWDRSTGMILMKYQHEAGAVNAVAYAPYYSYIASGGSDQKIYLYHFEAEGITDTLVGHMSAISDLHFTHDDKLISRSVDGMIKVWDTKTMTELYTYVQIDRSNWLTKNPQGYFDGTKKALEYVNYVSGMDVVPVSSLFEKYYTPGLILRIMEGETFETGENIHDMIEGSLDVELAITDTEYRGGGALVMWRDSIVPITISVNGETNPSEIRLYNNGKLVLSEDWKQKVQFRGGGDTKTCDIQLNAGRNEIKVVVVDEDQTESTPQQLDIGYDGKAALMDLYILAIGINDYENSSYDLNYAVNDAKTFLKSIKDGAGDLFSSVNEYLIKDKDAVRGEIEAALNNIMAVAGPEDVFIFYYAGHGVMSMEDKNGDSDFFIVTHDITNLYGDPQMLIDNAISATNMMEYARQILAEKQLFVLDACHSGGALESFAVRGGTREKALAQLAHSTGTYFLTASQDYQFANESGGLGHGLFTYAIIEALHGMADGGNQDKKITIGEMKSYVEDRVPELSEEYHGSAQYPTSYSFGQDFPLVIIE